MVDMYGWNLYQNSSCAFSVLPMRSSYSLHDNLFVLLCITVTEVVVLVVVVEVGSGPVEASVRQQHGLSLMSSR